MGDGFQAWVDAVCEEVRFRPDRKGIEKELRIHYEDHRQALEQLGYERPLAAERSLRAMGDAQEVGRALDRVHKPWLGWLWKASSWMVEGLVVLALVTMFHTVGWRSLVNLAQGELAWEEPPASAVRMELEHGTLWAAPGEVTEEDGRTVAEVRLWIKMRDPLLADNSIRTDYFTWRDQRGELPAREYDAITRTWTEGRCWQYSESSDERFTYGWTRFQQTVELMLEEPPQWAEVSYPLSGRDWALRVEWEMEP